jgi:hypothetical protein
MPLPCTLTDTFLPAVRQGLDFLSLNLLGHRSFSAGGSLSLIQISIAFCLLPSAFDETLIAYAFAYASD